MLKHLHKMEWQLRQAAIHFAETKKTYASTRKDEEETGMSLQYAMERMVIAQARLAEASEDYADIYNDINGVFIKVTSKEDPNGDET